MLWVLYTPLIMQSCLWLGLKNSLSTQFIYNDEIFLRFIQFYLRYIDEIFLIWNGIKEELDEFALKINNCHPITELEYHISKNQINFLVTTVSEFGNQLCTNLNQNTSILWRMVVHMINLCPEINFAATR